MPLDKWPDAYMNLFDLFLFFSSYPLSGSHPDVCVSARPLPSAILRPVTFCHSDLFYFFFKKRNREKQRTWHLFSKEQRLLVLLYRYASPTSGTCCWCCCISFSSLLIPHDLHARDVSIVLTITRKYHKSCEILVPRPPFSSCKETYLCGTITQMKYVPS